MVTGLLLLGTGCQTFEKYSLTYQLWSNGELRSFSEPAPNPNLALFEATNHSNLLVQYDALSEKSSTVKRRAYLLQPNEARTAPARKPKWVKPSVADGMRPVPVLPAPGVITNQSLVLPAYAVLTKEGRGFTLHRPRESEATFDLPVFVESSGIPTRMMLTPFVVVGDTLMVGAVVAGAGFLMWVHSGAPIY